MEVLAKKFDRFGWERDRGSAAHDRMVCDWMDALQDYPLDEVRAACRAAVLSNPNRMPNEGHVRAEIISARKRSAAHYSAPVAQPVLQPERTDEEKRRAAELVAQNFPTLKRMNTKEL